MNIKEPMNSKKTKNKEFLYLCSDWYEGTNITIDDDDDDGRSMVIQPNTEVTITRSKSLFTFVIDLNPYKLESEIIGLIAARL